jgi:hypothetical protein
MAFRAEGKIERPSSRDQTEKIMSSVPVPVEQSSARIVQQWLSQGETIYAGLVKECQALEAQLEDLETRLAAKHAEVNQVAQIIGKPPVEGNRRLSAQLVTSYAPDTQTNSTRSPIPPRIPARPQREPVGREVVPPRP